MKKCDQEFLIVDYFFDELPAQEMEDFQNHVQHCVECRRNLEIFQKTHANIGMNKRVEPGSVLLADYHRNIDKIIGHESLILVWLKNFLQNLIYKPSLPVRFAEAIAFIMIGILIGKTTFWKSENFTLNETENYNTVAQVSAEQLLLNNYLQEAEMVLLDVSNINPNDDELLLQNLIQTVKYRQLLQKTLLCKKEADKVENEELHNLIAQIELILLELCNLEGSNEKENLLEIKQNIKQSLLLLEIKAVANGKI